MTLQFDVTGPGKWELEYTDTVEAPDERKRFISRYSRLIEPFDVPIVFQSHILAIAASYPQAPATWYNCANIEQIAPGATIDDPEVWPDTTGVEGIIVDRHRLRLNQSLELFIFKPVSTDLRISFTPMPWLPKFSYGIYSFTGQAVDRVEEKVDAARAQLVTIETKIDDLRS